MSAYLFLRSTEMSDAAVDENESQRELCYANYCHPVFWMMLFDKQSITTTTETPGDEETYVLHGEGPMTEKEARARGLWEDEPLAVYPCLRTPAAEGIRRARQRWPAVETVLGSQYAELFHTWAAYIERNASGDLQLDPYEFWAITENTEEYVEQLETLIRAFDVAPTTQGGFLFKKSTPSDEWEMLFTLAQIDYDALGKRALSDRELCGYGSDENAPWSAEERP